MYAAERQQHIAQLISAEGRASVASLSSSLGVAQETIRRDLDQLQVDGIVVRVHGGAVMANKSSMAETSIRTRETTEIAAKERIASATVELIPTGFSGAVYLDAGTTTARVAGLLAAREQDNSSLTFITNSITTAAALSHLERPTVRVIGGRLRALTAAAVGAGALAQIADLRPDIAVMGTNAVHATFGLSTPDEAEAEVKRAAVQAARRILVVADATKLGGESLVRFAPLSSVDVLVTDAAPQPDVSAALADADAEVVVA